MKNIIIAIDGFSSSGKSTMARRLAKSLGYRYVDSGAMYRAVTLYALEHGMIGSNSNPDIPAIIDTLPDINIDFLPQTDGSQHTLLNGKDVESKIRTIEVSEAVSKVAAISEVRHALVKKQQEFGLSKGIVMDGRDIGTTVFPDAELKIYVNANAETRARRRFDELRAKGDNSTSYEEVLKNVTERDHIDMTRKESPLRRAEDAIDLDNSGMTLDEQDKWLYETAKRVIEHGHN